jgi:hypothetical protein
LPAVSFRKVFAPITIVQHTRIVALDQHQLALVCRNDVARAGIAVERGESRAEALTAFYRVQSSPECLLRVVSRKRDSDTACQIER